MESQNPSPATVDRCPMYDAAFAADPHQVYDRLREQGPAGPVELAPGVDATLVVDYETALRVLQNPSLFIRDSRTWKALAEGRVPLDSPVLPMLAYRPNAMMTDGTVHLRLRRAITDSLAKLNIRRVRRDVEPIAKYLIDQFSEHGRADLLNDYAKLLPLLLFNKLFGCPADIGDRLVSGMSGIFDGKDAAQALEEIDSSLMALIALKRRQPGDDVTSWLIQHDSGLTDDELLGQLTILMGAGVEPLRNLIGSALLLLLAPDTAGRSSGMLVEEALDHVLWHQPPLANYAAHYPVQDVDMDGVVAEAGTPVIISFAGANSDPALTESGTSRGKGAHLAWGAGPHSCPAKDPARVIALTAIEELLNALPDMKLAVQEEELQWRPGPFHRALASLPVAFNPSAATRMASVLRSRTESVATTPLPRTPSLMAESRGPERKKGFWSSFLDIFRV